MSTLPLAAALVAASVALAAPATPDPVHLVNDEPTRSVDELTTPPAELEQIAEEPAPIIVTPARPTITPVCAATFDDEPNVLAIEFDEYPADGYYLAESWDTDDVATVTAHVTDPAAYALTEDAVTEWTFDVAAMLPDCDTARHDDPVETSDEAPVNAPGPTRVPEPESEPEGDVGLETVALDLSALRTPTFRLIAH